MAMVMFKAKFKPVSDKAVAAARMQQQQQQQPQAQPQPQPQPARDDEKAPPIEKERGPQYPVKESGPGNPPERAR